MGADPSAQPPGRMIAKRVHARPVDTKRTFLCALFTQALAWMSESDHLGQPWGHSSAGRAPALQAGGRRFDPDWLHQFDSERCAHEKIGIKQADVEVGSVLFENLGRNKRFGSIESRCVVEASRRSSNELFACDPEATWGYMVKRLSAYGGCLGSQRR